jgi:hypothetical protein
MADLAVDDEDCGDLTEAEVMAGLLLGAGQEPPEAGEPTVGHFDDPPSWVERSFAWLGR